MKKERGKENVELTNEHPLDDPKHPEEESLGRRRFLKLGGAFAATGAAALSLPNLARAQDLTGALSDAGAWKGDIKEGEDILVDAKMIVDAMSSMTAELQGPSDALKGLMIEQLGQASAALEAQNGDEAIGSLQVFQQTVQDNLDELNASNGGLVIQGLGAGDTEGGIGDGLLNVTGFLLGLGPGIIFFLVVLLWPRILWILNCFAAFAGCLGFAQNFFRVCMAVCLVFFAIPIPGLGAAMAAACAIVCRALFAALVRACLAALMACLRAC